MLQYCYLKGIVQLKTWWIPKFQRKYLGSNTSSLDRDITKRIGRVWTAMESLSIIWMFDPSIERKKDFFKAVGVNRGRWCVCVFECVWERIEEFCAISHLHDDEEEEEE